MKRILLTATAGLLLAGCISSEDRSSHPQSSIVGDGPFMPGLYDSREPATGQFTGQERTLGSMGPQPVLPAGTDARELDHSAPPIIGAGSLGQSGIKPDSAAVTGATLMEHPANSGAQGAAPNIYRPSGVGSAPGVESGANMQTNNPSSNLLK